MSPLKTWAPPVSLMSTLCGWPASLLSKWIVNAAPAGALTSFCSNWTPCAEIWTGPAPAPPLAGACDPAPWDAGAPDAGAPDAGAPDAGAPDADPDAAAGDGGGEVGAA